MIPRHPRRSCFFTALAAHVLARVAPVNRYLAIYLNDHLAGATLGLELIRRASKEHQGELGEFLHELRNQIEQDYGALLDVMAAVGVKRSRIKPAVAWAVEKVGRLKLNGQLIARSPLTPLVELEGTATGIAGKLRLWQALREVVEDEALRARLDELAARAERQLADLEPRRLAAARLAARS
jgi:hypothetical protein